MSTVIIANPIRIVVGLVVLGVTVGMLNVQIDREDTSGRVRCLRGAGIASTAVVVTDVLVHGAEAANTEHDEASSVSFLQVGTHAAKEAAESCSEAGQYASVDKRTDIQLTANGS